jgi:hypothetical protein
MSLLKTSRGAAAWLACGQLALGDPSATQVALDAAGHWVADTCQRATIDRGTYWSSQPGALRTYDRNTGAWRALYKLYSSPEPVITDLSRLEIDRPAGWATDPSRWVDLNEPSTVDGRLVYPIVDPAADAEGFSFIPAPGSNPLPLPVAWLYVTRDGTLGSLDADHRFVPLVNPRTSLPMGASEDNPLIARVAWWCDDTTCKLNINTASEGVFWDTPRCDTTEERAYGTFQPARGEWQRDMGHPAAVCLSSVLFPGHRLHVPGTTSALAPLPLEHGRAIWRNAPGIPDGGSLGGTAAVNPAPDGAVEEPVRELFANGVDLAAAENLPTDARARAARSGFFLTARSRAPDYTLSGAPRVSLWPLASPHWQSAVSGEATPASGTITEFDALMAEASSLHFNGTRQPMAVVRANAHSQFEDLDYLERGGRGNTGRNRQLSYYLFNRFYEAGDGRTRSLSSKYGVSFNSDDLGALAASALDYIRQVNVSDPCLPPPARFIDALDPAAGAGQVTPLTFVGGTTVQASLWDSRSVIRRGTGRFPTLAEAALVVSLRHRTLAGVAPSGFYGTNQALAEGRGSQFNHYEIEVSLLLEAFAPAQTSDGIVPRVSFTLGGYSGRTQFSRRVGQDFDVGVVTLNGQPLVFPVNDAARSTAAALLGTDGKPAGWTGGGGNLGVRTTRQAISFKPILFSQAPGEAPPLLSFSGTGQVSPYDHWRLFIQDSDSPFPANGVVDSDNLIQTIALAFPPIAAGPPLPFGDDHPLPMRDAVDDRMKRARASGALLGTGGLFHEPDVVFSLVPNHGDFRLIAAPSLVRAPISGTWRTFVGHPSYGLRMAAHALTEPALETTRALRLAVPYTSGLGAGEEDHGYFNGLIPSPPDGPLLMQAPSLSHRPDFPIKPWSAMPVVRVGYSPPSQADVRAGSDVFQSTRLDLRFQGEQQIHVRGVASPELTGDFDNGIAGAMDGPYTNAPDAGDARAWASGGTPYFDNLDASRVDNPGTFSPHRHMPSSMMLGSLPTGVASNTPWQTLLFRPDPLKGTDKAHYGSTRAPDHHIADVFRMPVVKPSGPMDWTRPWAVWKPSDAFSTEGRINMNHQIVPFTHVRRTTALHGLLKAQKVLAIPDEAGPEYKTGAGTRPWRRHIDATETLRQWETKFASGDVFRSSSEIAELWLVTEGATLEQMPAFWARHRLTGDNSKEKPYATLYPHLTTRSLTFDLHLVAEEIRKDASTSPDRFVPGADQAVGRVRRSLPLTGRIDPKDPAMPDFIWDDRQALNLPALDSFIVWSVPGVAPVEADEPVLTEAATEWDPGSESGRLVVRWAAAPSQTCLLESSSDMISWSPRGSFRTGESRDLMYGDSRALSNARQAEVFLFVPKGTASLYVRLRWEPTP